MPASRNSPRSPGRSRSRRATGPSHLRVAPSVYGGSGRSPRTRRHNTPSRSPRRLAALLIMVLAAFGAIGARLVVLQVGQFPRFARLAAAQREREFTFPAHRGTIFDRNGESLAISVELQTVFTDHVHVEDPYRTAAKLAPLLDQPRDVIERKLHPSWSGDQFEYLARQIDPGIAQEIKDLELPGIYLKPEPKRIYPSDNLASHVLGFVNAEGDALEGVELQYDEILRGHPGMMALEQDPQGRPLPQADFVYEPARPGRSIYLTLDKDLQYFTELTLARAVQKYSAVAGSAIIMRPRTGEILALANMPDYDLNEFSDVSPDFRRNRAIVDNYEPGSAFKAITLAAALEERVVRPTTVFQVQDELQVSDRVIHDSHSHVIEDMTVSEIIEQSSNVGTVKLGLALGADKIDEWVRRFGFGSATGLDFPGEAEGIVLDRNDWSGSTIGTVPLGQGIAVTPLQLVSAYSAIANHGVWVEPKIVRSMMAADGTKIPASPPARRRVVSRTTSRQVLEILTRVVSDGTGILAQTPGYIVAGKTGTAQKPLPTGGYGDSYMASFVGLAPANRPEIAVIVTLDEPDPIWGGATAAPTFRLIAEEALRRLGVPPTADAESEAAAIKEDQADEPTPRD
jgi:cell division protein FtsI (penicillin-binding protein 3)